MTEHIRILIIEDDPAVRNLMVTTLKGYGYPVLTAGNGQEGILKAATDGPGMVLLDLGLPDLDGLEVIENLRSWSDMPIIILSARNAEKDKISALDAGADDYLTKPFSVNELMARIRVAERRVLRHLKTEEEQQAVFENGPLTVDYAAGRVTLDGNEIHLTPIEYRLLCLLTKNVGKVLTHAMITREVWGSIGESESASLRVYMASLRKKIAKSSECRALIQTKVGVGYRMNRIEDASDEAASVMS